MKLYLIEISKIKNNIYICTLWVYKTLICANVHARTRRKFQEAKMLEKELEKKFKYQIEKRGAMVLKFVSPGKAGVPGSAGSAAIWQSSFRGVQSTRRKAEVIAGACYERTGREEV